MFDKDSEGLFPNEDAKLQVVLEVIRNQLRLIDQAKLEQSLRFAASAATELDDKASLDWVIDNPIYEAINSILSNWINDKNSWLMDTDSSLHNLCVECFSSIRDNYWFHRAYLEVLASCDFTKYKNSDGDSIEQFHWDNKFEACLLGIRCMLLSFVSRIIESGVYGFRPGGVYFDRKECWDFDVFVDRIVDIAELEIMWDEEREVMFETRPLLNDLYERTEV